MPRGRLSTVKAKEWPTEILPKSSNVSLKGWIRGKKNDLEELPAPVGRRQPPLSRMPRVSTVTLGIRLKKEKKTLINPNWLLIGWISG